MLKDHIKHLDTIDYFFISTHEPVITARDHPIF